MVKELIRSFEKRRDSMISKLKNQADDLDAARQHQMYGAILEIDVFLKALRYYVENEDMGGALNLESPRPK